MCARVCLHVRVCVLYGTLMPKWELEHKSSDIFFVLLYITTHQLVLSLPFSAWPESYLGGGTPSGGKANPVIQDSMSRNFPEMGDWGRMPSIPRGSRGKPALDVRCDIALALNLMT